MKLYTKIIDGQTYTMPANKIVVIKDGMQIFNPTEEILFSDGWKEHVASVIELTEEQLLIQAKESKILDINEYDNSENINKCYILITGHTLPYWKDKTERSSLKTAVQDYIAQGRETYRLDLRELGVSVTIPCDTLLHMLGQLEVYATECYNKTTDHIFVIQSLDNIEEIKEYDYKTGYPEVLQFNF